MPVDELKPGSDVYRVIVVSVRDDKAAARSPRGLFSAEWWTASRGWSGLAQWPNSAIVVWLLSVVVVWADVVDDKQLRLTVVGVGHGAVIVWALDELVRGVSPIRRLMGAGALTALCVHLLS